MVIVTATRPSSLFRPQAMDLEVPVLARNIPGNAAVVKHEVTGLLFSDPQVRKLLSRTVFVGISRGRSGVRIFLPVPCAPPWWEPCMQRVSSVAPGQFRKSQNRDPNTGPAPVPDPASDERRSLEPDRPPDAWISGLRAGALQTESWISRTPTGVQQDGRVSECRHASKQRMQRAGTLCEDNTWDSAAGSGHGRGMTGGGGTSRKRVKGSGVRPWVSARSWARGVWPGLGLQAVFSGTSRAPDRYCPLGRCRAQAEGHTGLSVFPAHGQSSGRLSPWERHSLRHTRCLQQEVMP